MVKLIDVSQYSKINQHRIIINLSAEKSNNLQTNIIVKTFKCIFFYLIRFSIIDAWVSSYLLVLIHYASEKSRLRTLLAHHTQLVDYVQRINEEQLLLRKERDDQPLVSPISSENPLDVVSILHVISQMVSFSIFIFMLTKIGANSYAMTSQTMTFLCTPRSSVKVEFCE